MKRTAYVKLEETTPAMGNNNYLIKDNSSKHAHVAFLDMAKQIAEKSKHEITLVYQKFESLVSVTASHLKNRDGFKSKPDEFGASVDFLSLVNDKDTNYISNPEEYLVAGETLLSILNHIHCNQNPELSLAFALSKERPTKRVVDELELVLETMKKEKEKKQECKND